MIMNTIFCHKLILLQTKRNVIIKRGSAINVNAILIEKTSGIGLIGKEYKPFPTKKRSR